MLIPWSCNILWEKNIILLCSSTHFMFILNIKSALANYIIFPLASSHISDLLINSLQKVNWEGKIILIFWTFFARFHEWHVRFLTVSFLTFLKIINNFSFLFVITAASLLGTDVIILRHGQLGLSPMQILLVVYWYSL